jgi:hypothetical protein
MSMNVNSILITVDLDNSVTTVLARTPAMDQSAQTHAMAWHAQAVLNVKSMLQLDRLDVVMLTNALIPTCAAPVHTVLTATNHSNAFQTPFQAIHVPPELTHVPCMRSVYQMEAKLSARIAMNVSSAVTTVPPTRTVTTPNLVGCVSTIPRVSAAATTVTIMRHVSLTLAWKLATTVSVTKVTTETAIDNTDTVMKSLLELTDQKDARTSTNAPAASIHAPLDNFVTIPTVVISASTHKTIPIHMVHALLALMIAIHLQHVYQMLPWRRDTTVTAMLDTKATETNKCELKSIALPMADQRDVSMLTNARKPQVVTLTVVSTRSVTIPKVRTSAWVTQIRSRSVIPIHVVLDLAAMQSTPTRDMHVMTPMNVLMEVPSALLIKFASTTPVHMVARTLQRSRLL